MSAAWQHWREVRCSQSQSTPTGCVGWSFHLPTRRAFFSRVCQSLCIQGCISGICIYVMLNPKPVAHCSSCRIENNPSLPFVHHKASLSTTQLYHWGYDHQLSPVIVVIECCCKAFGIGTRPVASRMDSIRSTWSFSDKTDREWGPSHSCTHEVNNSAKKITSYNIFTFNSTFWVDWQPSTLICQT